MKCHRCQHENLPEAKFCESCALPLGRTCANCGTPLRDTAKFCPACAHPVSAPPATPQPFRSPKSYTPKHLAERILTSKSALEGERKLVTVLFVDVVGSTSLAERLDPEEVHAIMGRALELMLGEVHRYEGTVNQFLGDGIMALFGAPIAHEDHARRAMHAALAIVKALEPFNEELQRTRRLGLKVRQGLNTGLVVVGSIGDDLRMDYTAVGDTTNVAARLQQAAVAGQILISEHTRRLVEGYFHVRPVGGLSLKGKAEPMPGWELLAAQVARARIDIEADRGLTPFVGRERELRLLLECYDKAKAGHGQVVLITGDPGIGKSRLLLEFRRRLAGEVTWSEGRSLSFGHSIAFHPLIDMLKRSFGIEESDSEATIVERIEHSVLALGEDLRPLVPYLRYLLSVDPGKPSVLAMDPQQRRGEIFDALRRMTSRTCEACPQVTVYEDLQWIDQATEDYLLYTADSVPTSRILRIVTYRAGHAHPFGERTYHTRMVLGALSSEASIEMTEAMLVTDGLPEELKALIARKAEGNPFFVEEVVKSLLELQALRRAGGGYVLAKPIEEIVVPDTIQDVIMARIDRLEEAPKRIAQLASVIGREFTHRLLERLSDVGSRTQEALRQLKAIELIYEKTAFPELGYMFKHALTQEVAYSSLLLQRRKELHRLAGLAIEELYPDRLAEHYEVLAHHFARAEAWDRALDYLLKAAEKAEKAFATREAIALYDKALEVAGEIGERVPHRTLMGIHQARAELYVLVSDFEQARAEGERALVIARGIGDRIAEGMAFVSMGLASWLGHKFDRALVDAQQAIEVGEDVGAESVLAGGHLTTALVYEMTGRLEEAGKKFGQVIKISRSAGDAANESWALVFAAEIKGWAAEFDEATRLYREGIQLARAHNVLVPQLEGLFMYGINLTGKGEYEGAVAALEEGLALAEKVGDENYTPRYLNSLGWISIECGDLDRAVELNRQGSEGARKRRDHESFANAELNLADIALARGDLGSAQEILDGVHRLVKDPATSDWMRWRYSMHLFASLGELSLARSDPVNTRECAEQCLALAMRTNSRKYVVNGWWLKAGAALLRRDWGEAERALREALGIATTIGSPTLLWKTYFALGRVHSELKQPEIARQDYRAACAVIARVKNSFTDPRLRATFDNSPLIRQVYQMSADS